MKLTIGIALCILSGTFIVAGQDSGQAADQAAGKTFEKTCGNCHDPSTATSEKHTRREWQGIVEDMASRGATATPDELREIAGWLSRHNGNVRINQLNARDLQQEMELPAADAEAIVAYRTKNGRIENFEALKKTGVDPSKLESYKDSIVY
jgi:Helix-hairpin-helix motif